MSSTITINGRSYSGSSVSIVGDRVIIDGVLQNGDRLSGVISIEVTGDLADLTTDASATVTGDVRGNLSAGGSVTCGAVGGALNAGGSVSCGSISGRVNAGGSVSANRIG